MDLAMQQRRDLSSLGVLAGHRPTPSTTLLGAILGMPPALLACHQKRPHARRAAIETPPRGHPLTRQMRAYS